MKSPSVYAIIINWNGKIDTLLCLSSLEKVRKNYPTLTVIVVDNGSTDGTSEEVRRKFPWVRIQEVGTNLGFSGGSNAGISFARDQHADFIWLLNNDTVVDTNVLSALSAFQDLSVGAVGSKIYFYKGCEFHKDRYDKKDLGRVLWYAGGIIDWNNMLAFHRGVDEVDHGQYDREEETDFITGCSFFMRTSMMEKIGPLDESYFMYMEDLDFSLRIHKAGLKTVYNPTSIVWHKNASSSGGSGSSLHVYYQTRNRLKIGMTYAPWRTKLALLREAGKILFGSHSIKKQAVVDFLLGHMGRRHEK